MSDGIILPEDIAKNRDAQKRFEAAMSAKFDNIFTNTAVQLFARLVVSEYEAQKLANPGGPVQIDVPGIANFARRAADVFTSGMAQEAEEQRKRAQ